MITMIFTYHLLYHMILFKFVTEFYVFRVLFVCTMTNVLQGSIKRCYLTKDRSSLFVTYPLNH